MRHGAAERSHEYDPVDIQSSGQPEDALAEGPPPQVRLLADKQRQVARCMAIDGVRGQFKLPDQPVLDRHRRPKQPGHLHRAGYVVDVKRFRVDFGDRLGVQQLHQVADGARGDVAAIHPAGEGQHQGRVVKRRRLVHLQEIAFVSRV